MPSQDGLIVSPNGEYKSREQIIYDNMEKEPPSYKENPYKEVSFDDMVEEMIRRRDARREIEGIPDKIELEIKTDTPIIIGLFGDQHMSGKEVDYEMLRRDVHFISSNPKCYTILGGDIVDGAAFNPAQDDKIASFTEESAMAIKMFDALGKNSILVALQGDHDMWSERGGPTMYQTFVERYNTPLMRGSSVVILKVGGTEYRIVCAHQVPGSSIYNKSHPENRESKFGKQNADVYVGFHNHTKALSQQPVEIAGESPKMQTFVAGGPYKLTDSYTKKKGWGSKEQSNDAVVGAVWLVLHPYRREVEAFWSMESAKERIEPYLTGKLKESKPADPIDIIKEIAK
jgi:hypothetical protein